MYDCLVVNTDRDITIVTLNRPEKSNALNGQMVKELSLVLDQCAIDPATRIVMINGKGKHFCAGADIAWMQQMSDASFDENFEDAERLAALLYQLYTFPKPTLLLAHGASFGGALGLISACDIALASDDVIFSFSEVKMGLTPSTISPYVIAAIGERAAHYYFLTGARFGAADAYRLGLIHRVVSSADLQTEGMNLANELLQGSPHAVSEVKYLIQHVAKELITPELGRKTAEHLARVRTAPDARLGLKAFIEKRPPVWR